MKILITLDFPPEQGGIQRYLYGIVKFTYSKDDCVLAGCSGQKKTSYNELPPCIRRFSTPFSGWNKKISCIPIFFYLIKKLLCIQKYPEIECGNVYAAIVPWFLSFFIKKMQYSVYTYGTEIIGLNKSSLRTVMIKQILNKADKIYTLGNYTARLLKDAGIKKIPYINPPKIVLPEYTDTGGKISCKKNDILHILCVGRLVPHKGHSVLINAISMLPKELACNCVIVGDGPLLSGLKAMTVKKNIEDRIIIKTKVPDEELWKEYEQASIFVLPSKIDNGAEGFGIVLLEAMSRGLPIIASRTGGITEVLDNGNCGILVEPGNASDLGQAIIKLYSEPEQQQILMQNAYKRVRNFYAW